MQILARHHVRFTDDDVIFRESAIVTVAVGLLFLAASGALFAAFHVGAVHWFVSLPSSALLLLFALLSGRIARKASGPENWLLACNGQRLLIKFRSYLNTRFPAADPHVLVLDLSEVAGVREARMDLKFRLRRTGPERRRARFLDVIVNDVDLKELRERLQYERELATGAGWRAHPVTVTGDDTIRIEWRSARSRVTPGLPDALRVIGATTARQEAHREEVDFTAYRALPPDVLEGEIRKLVERGETLPATKIVQFVYGLNTTEAHQLVAAILAGAPTAADPASTSRRRRESLVRRS